MKIRWKHIVCSALALAFCLSLAACGNSDDVAGEDWRTSGMVAASGTITHDGESVDVLVTVSESSAAFYRDLPEQVRVLSHEHSRRRAGLQRHFP